MHVVSSVLFAFFLTVLPDLFFYFVTRLIFSVAISTVLCTRRVIQWSREFSFFSFFEILPALVISLKEFFLFLRLDIREDVGKLSLEACCEAIADVVCELREIKSVLIQSEEPHARLDEPAVLRAQPSLEER